MAKTSQLVAGLTIGAFVGLAGGLALTPGPADAGYGVAPAPATVSNTVSKADMFVTERPLPVARKPLANAVEVAEVQKVGDDIILLDAKGRIVYRSEPRTASTTVAKGADLPLVTGYGVASDLTASSRVRAAFQAASN